MEIMSYHFYENPYFANQVADIIKSNKSTEEKASIICNDLLTYGEHNYLNLLRERYNISNSDFTTIMSGIGCGVEMRSPAGYGKEQNISLIIQMIVARYYMTPQNNSAFYQINTMIVGLAQGMKGIRLTQQNINSLFSLTEQAMKIYGNNFALKQIEDFVISHWE